MEKLYVGVISDALQHDFGLEHQFIKASCYLGLRKTVCGPAFTCTGKNLIKMSKKQMIAYDRIRVDMLDGFEQGQVQVISCGDSTEFAHYGDISALSILSKRGKGIFLDGLTRDAKFINEMDLGVACNGIHIKDSLNQWAIVDYMKPVVINDVKIKYKDIIFLSNEGCIVIPQDIIYNVAEKAFERSIKEAEIRRRFIIGEDPKTIFKEMGRW